MPDGAVVYQSMNDAVPEGAQVIAEHPLGRFDMSKLGTGEGAQAYGRGLYFAESEDVAGGYRKKLSRDNLAQRAKDDQSYDTLVGLGLDESPDLGAFSIILSEADGDMARAIQDSMTPRYPDDPLPAFAQSMADAMKSGRLPASIELPTLNKGSMYEVDIDANPDELLDWDLPLSKQSDFVREKLQALGDADNKKAVGEYDDALLDALFNDSNKALPKQPVDLSGKHLYYRSAPDATDPADASKALKDIGIKGIRYKDGFSRGTDGGTSNYVIFDDRLISIAKKYGIAIPAAAAYLARMTGEDTSQSYQEAS
jgi:hypothetical protein